MTADIPTTTTYNISIKKPEVKATPTVTNITTYETPVLAVVATLVFPVAFELAVAVADVEAAPASDGA